ncbi:MAG TPA: ABC transporter permease [Rhodanobacteraceae bacterium]|nr:ABC transporter permease [Rhodanobacteraceae bacterium]
MFAYYLHLALRSLRRNWIMTALMVLAIGLGIGASMTMLTVLHVMGGHPLPGRSAHLYRPHIDPLPADMKADGDWDPSDNFTWPDAMALLQAHKAPHQAAMSGGRVLVHPPAAGARPFFVNGRYATADFFAMFGVPFVAGHAWSAAADEHCARVVVLDEALARRVFGGIDVVGQSLRLGEHAFRVIGVTAHWQPQPLFYADASASAFGRGDRFFLPLATAHELQLDVAGNISTWVEGKSDLGGASTSWLQLWVELDTPAQVAAYRQFLHDYSAQQKALGRFERPPSSARLYSLAQWLDHENLVPGDVRLQAWLAFGFLLVCLVNIMALLLAKFLRRSGEVSVRRALGARRRDVFVQFGVESAAVGVAGGALGLAVAQLGLWSVRQRPDDYAHLAQMDAGMLLGTFLLAIVASLLAGLLPAWRACHVPPALHLKTL